MCLSQMCKSPINYTGNKYRILPQYIKFFPKHVNKFIDLFTGGATVAINIKATETLAIDKNKYVINLLDFLQKQEYDRLIEKIDRVIQKYKLSNSYKNGYSYYKEYVIGNNGLKKYNKIGFENLKKDYNELKNKNTNKANIYLYLLIIYGFNNDIRFNSKNEFNLPVGKTDMNKNNREKLKKYIQMCKNKKIDYLENDFRKIKDIKLKKGDFVYADPPYLITDAVYNENAGWNKKDEKDLLKVLDLLDKNGIQFALSNVLEKTSANIKNEILDTWLNNNKGKYYIHDIEYNYKSSSYNKKNRNCGEREVLITNYNLEEE